MTKPHPGHHPEHEQDKPVEEFAERAEQVAARSEDSDQTGKG